MDGLRAYIRATLWFAANERCGEGRLRGGCLRGKLNPVVIAQARGHHMRNLGRSRRRFWRQRRRPTRLKRFRPPKRASRLTALSTILSNTYA